MGYKIHEQDLYDYTASNYCGVLVTKRVMQKLVKLQAEHLAQVKRLLLDEADDGNVYASSWTLFYPNGEQTIVRYIDTGADVKQCIKSATTSTHCQPKKESLVFYAGSMDDAKAQAQAHFDELKGD